MSEDMDCRRLMRHRVSWQRIAIWISTMLLGATGSLTAGDNYEYWSQFGASMSINEHWALEFEEELRIGEDASRLYNHNSAAGLLYKGVTRWLDLGLSFLRDYEKDDQGTWHPENRTRLNLKMKTVIAGFGVSNRTRFEYRDLDIEPDFWRYRHMLKVTFPGKYTALELQPYVAEEPFLYLNGRGFIKNRLYSGVGFTLSQRISGALFYLCESSKSSGHWDANHIVGTRFVLHLP